jgi:hypothetical protein
VTGLRHPTVQIPQVLTAALAASVYICLAQRMGAYFVEDEYRRGNVVDWAELLFGGVSFALIFLWTAKNSIDEFKSFSREPGAAFSLFWTVMCSAAAYVALATSASMLFDGMKAIWGLVAFFGICTFWSLNSVYRYSKLQSHQRDAVKERRRRLWTLWYPNCGLALAIVALLPGLNWTDLAAAIPLGVLVWDARHSATFESNNPVGA